MIFNIEEYKSQLNACNLNTVMIIENFILNNSGKYSKTELWNALPKDVRYQSCKVLIDFLIFSKKIFIENKKIHWSLSQKIFDNTKYNSQNRMPTLTSLSNILEFISKNENLFSKTELWKALPKKIMYQTYKVAIEYLIDSKLLEIQNKKIILGGNIK